MKRSRAIAWFVLLAVIATVAAFFALRPGELVYQGKSVSAWIADLGSNDRQRIERAHKALVALGEPAMPYLAKTIETKESKFHSHYLQFWSSRKLPQSLQRLLPTPISHLHQARVNGVGVLGQMGPKASPAVSTLVRALGDADEGMRMMAAEALGKIGPEARPAIPALVNMLKEDESFLRQTATYSLIRIGDPTGKAIEPLTALLNDKNNELTGISADIALWLLEGKSQPTLDLLRKNVDPIDWRTRLFTADYLGDFGAASKVSVPALLELLHDENEAVREHAVEALRKIDPAAAEKAGVK
jgi:HEAT repeat protein